MTTYLSRLFLDSRNRQVRRDLGDCHQLHRTILKAFGDVPDGTPAREYFGVLFRAEVVPEMPGLVRLLVQSAAPPDWSKVPPGYLGDTLFGLSNVSTRILDTVYERIADGLPLVFRLRANPTKRISDRTAGRADPLVGKRVELLREADQIAWLQRKGEQYGFQVLETDTASDIPDVQVAQGEKIHGRKHDGRLSFGAVTFNGRLKVTNSTAFNQALIHGIGSGRAFGFGLLSVAEIG